MQTLISELCSEVSHRSFLQAMLSHIQVQYVPYGCIKLTDKHTLITGISTSDSAAYIITDEALLFYIKSIASMILYYNNLCKCHV